MTKELFVLAAWVMFAAGIMAFAGSWHPKTYTVVHAYATEAPSGLKSQTLAVTP